MALFPHPCALSPLPICLPHFLLSPRFSRLPVFFIPSKTVAIMHPDSLFLPSSLAKALKRMEQMKAVCLDTSPALSEPILPLSPLTSQGPLLGWGSIPAGHSTTDMKGHGGEKGQRCQGYNKRLGVDLDVIVWVPVRVVDDNCVRCGQIDAQATGTC